MMVLSVGLILAAMMIINAQTAVRSVRLNESAASYANLLQQARIRAIRDDRYYTVLPVVPAAGSPFAFLDLQNTGVLAPGDPIVAFQSGVIPQPFAAGPSLANLKSQFLPPGPSAQNTVNFVLPGPTFGPRGLPCAPAVGAGGTVTCPYLTPPNFTPTSFISFLQNVQDGRWRAITVTPAGRIRQWSYDGAGTWSPLD
jgi:Tfp pilus assembly protein FimT